MSHKNPIRKDKTCLNCNYVVENRFCPNCGQENTDTRKTFYHLFVHFFEDLTHYENAFWKTIRNLILKPAALTKEYLSGKRLSYLAPVRLYIFISFITFFLFAVLPDSEDKKLVKISDKKEKGEKQIDSAVYKSYEEKMNKLISDGKITPVERDSLQKIFEKTASVAKDDSNWFSTGYRSVEELDSVRKVNPDEVGDLEYFLSKKSIEINEKFTGEEIEEKFIEGIKHNFPKVLFIYMPLFAFFLWLFHSKKKWYYFDHGIFTLHYFSFLLLISLIMMLTDFVFGYFDSVIISFLSGVISFGGTLWMIYYFYPAHHRFYGETRVVSFIKSTLLFVVNLFFFALIFVFFLAYTFFNIH